MRRRRLIAESNRRQLAIEGGPAAAATGPPAWPPHDDHILAQLRHVFESGDWGRYHGEQVDHLTRLIAERHNVSHVLTCSSGTVAVELALRGLKIAPGEEVILAGYDFAGNFRAIEAVDATPVLVDLANNSWAIDVQQIEAAVSDKTTAILVSHLHSSIAPMRQIVDLARRHELAVVEDACQAQGALVEGQPAGTWGDVGVWSFGGSKLLTSGRGGAIFTSREDVFQRAKVFCERGNHAYPLSELQAAVLPPQLAKLDERNEQRNVSADFLLSETADLKFLIPSADNPPESRPGYYKLSWLYSANDCGGRTRAEFIAAAQAEGVALDEGFRGFTRRPASRCRKSGTLTNAQRAAEATVVLHHPVLLQHVSALRQIADGLHKIAEAWS